MPWERARTTLRHRSSLDVDLKEGVDLLEEDFDMRAWASERVLVVATSLLVLTAVVGCAPFRLISNVLHATGAGMVPADYKELEGRRLAIVCASDSLSYGPSAAATQLSRNLGALLAANVKDITIVPQKKVDDWYDKHDSDNFDVPAMGNGVGADAVLVVDLHSLNIYDGQTLFKGRAELEMVVYLANSSDDKKNKATSNTDGTPKWRVDYKSAPPEIQFPRSAGITTTEISETEFRRRFMAILAGRLARTFYRHDARDDMPLDSPLLD
ncbi:MAG: hypothetical protein O3C60_10215 [Planctomycetota bacterium]|nr:hypothetical protein [Planctomycetota bacterium]